MYDLIVIGCGSAGLSVGLTMGKLGFKVLMVSKTDHAIGGDCLNEGCVPSKAFIHVANIIHEAKEAENFGFLRTGSFDIKKAVNYVYEKQEIIRAHENAEGLRKQGVDVALGEAHFIAAKEIEVGGKSYRGKKIVIATGSRPKKLTVPGVEKVTYYDNENIFHIEELPPRLLVIGGGPVSMEIAQAMCRMGSSVTVVHKGEMILEHDDQSVTGILRQQLQKEGIAFLFGSEIQSFPSSKEAIVLSKEGLQKTISFDAVFVGIGRELNFETLQLHRAGIEIKNRKIVVDEHLRTTNKKVFVCGDVAGGLQFSHAAEYHARILLNNFFSPLKKKLNNARLSWVTFTDPELASFGFSESQLKEKNRSYTRLEQDFTHDDRAITDHYQYGKLVLFISDKSLLKKQTILGGTMVAPHAGELIQELILSSDRGLSINTIFNKIYPYPTASRINQKLVVNYMEKRLNQNVKKWLRRAFKVFS